MHLSPSGRAPISTKWVFKRKFADRGYNLYKARLVAKGFAQREHVDYGDTYAPVSSLITVRCLLAVVAARRERAGSTLSLSASVPSASPATAHVVKGAAVTPLTYALRLDADDTTPALSSADYLGMVGKVAYAGLCTRPDLSFPHSWLAGGGQKRTLQYTQEAERTLRYMRETKYFGLLHHGGRTRCISVPTVIRGLISILPVRPVG